MTCTSSVGRKRPGGLTPRRRWFRRRRQSTPQQWSQPHREAKNQVRSQVFALGFQYLCTLIRVHVRWGRSTGANHTERPKTKIRSQVLPLEKSPSHTRICVCRLFVRCGNFFVMLLDSCRRMCIYMRHMFYEVLCDDDHWWNKGIYIYLVLSDGLSYIHTYWHTFVYIHVNMYVNTYNYIRTKHPHT